MEDAHLLADWQSQAGCGFCGMFDSFNVLGLVRHEACTRL
jgi:hypothetical protein